MMHPSVPVYDARVLCTGEGNINTLGSYRKDQLQRVDYVDIEVGSFVGIVYCAKWIGSPKRGGKERVQPSIAEIYLLADPEVTEW